MSKFLYLNQLKLTLPEDQTKYKRMTKSLYYREGFRLISFGFFCALYNLASLPTPQHPTHKMMFFGGLIGAFGIATFMQESKKLNHQLEKLDQKYAKDYEQYKMKEKEGLEVERVRKEQEKAVYLEGMTEEGQE